jgi:hypothetical protein
LKDGRRFQIKTRMRGHRALFWHEHIGGGQYRLRIHNNNSRNNRQWWIFDSRTKTIRAWADRQKVVCNQLGHAFHIGRIAVARQWKGENYQRIQWHGGSRKNIRNNGGKCLDVWGGKNNNN